MNYKFIRKTLSKILMLESIIILVPILFCIIYKESFINYLGYLVASAISIALSYLFRINSNTSKSFGAKEGLVTVGLSWIIICIIGALPYTISKQIPSYFDSFFEICSGFSTTGSSILTDVESMSKSYLFYRSLSQWIGGMGILVFVLAFMADKNDNNSIHILRAESTGPSVGKISTKMKFTTQTLYFIYIGLTLLEIIILLVLKNPLFDSICISLSTTATGGFSLYNAGLANISIASQYVVIVFMFLAGINFSLFYFLLIRQVKKFFANEELRWYFIIVVLSTLIITINLKGRYTTIEETIRHSLFQVVSIITTTGFSTVDFGDWPTLSLCILCIIMLIGSCAGSTAGGVKISRLLLVTKSNIKRVENKINSNRVVIIKLNKESISDDVVRETKTFFATYVIILILITLLISFDGSHDLLTNLTASLSSISNVGPGLGGVGPASNYSTYSDFSKIILGLEMLVGRLELYPILVLLTPETWKTY